MKKLERKPNVGETLKYVAESLSYLTHDMEYEIVGIDDSDGVPYFYDDDGDREYIHPHSYGNYQVKEDDLEDPGNIELVEVEEDTADEDGMVVIRVAVDEKAFKTIQGLIDTHRKAVSVAAIKAQIAELEAELKKLT